MLERVWRKGTLPREYKLVGRTVPRFLKKLKIELPYDQAVPLLCMYQEETKSKRYMHPNVHCSTVYNSEDMEAT